MRLKCIGGDNHGNYQTVPSHYREGDTYRIAVLPEVEVNVQILPEMITVNHFDFYVVEILKYSDKNKNLYEFKFLRHVNINLVEALRIALVY